MNSLNTSMAHESSPTHIDFLDTTVKINDNREIYTTLYEKLTDTNLYLHCTSSHHAPSKTKGPYGQFLRLRRICTYDSDFEQNSEKLIQYYQKRDYPEKSLRKHYQRASKYKQDDLLDVIEKTPVKTPVMVTNYNPMNPNIKGIIHRNWNIISNSPDRGPIFLYKPLIGFRRLPNLRDYLTNATTTYPPTPMTKSIPHIPICTRLGKYTYYPLIKKVGIVKCNVTKKSFKPIDLQNMSHVNYQMSYT